MADRITQVTRQVILEGDPSARWTQVARQTYVEPNAAAQFTQVFRQVWTDSVPNGTPTLGSVHLVQE